MGEQGSEGSDFVIGAEQKPQNQEPQSPRPDLKLRPSSEVALKPDGRLSSRMKRETRETVGTAKKKGWRRWLAASAVSAALLFGANAAKNTYDANVEAPRFGEPVSAQSRIVELQYITNEGGENEGPTFREDAKISGKELTKEELLARGIDPNAKNVTIIEILGGGYPGNPMAEGSNVEGDEGTTGYGHIVNKDEKAVYGIWGEVFVDNKPTGVFLSKNFYTEPEQPQSPENLSE